MAFRTVGQGQQSLSNLASFPESFMRTYRELSAETGEIPTETLDWMLRGS